MNLIFSQITLENLTLKITKSIFPHFIYQCFYQSTPQNLIITLNSVGNEPQFQDTNKYTKVGRLRLCSHLCGLLCPLPKFSVICFRKKIPFCKGIFDF